MACVGGSGLEWVGLREWMVCAWFKKKIPFENWKNRSISVYILGMLGPLVERAVNGMHTVNIRHYNNKQHHSLVNPWHVCWLQWTRVGCFD